MTDARLFNAFAVRCPDGTLREPTPSEVRAVVRSAAVSYVSLTGEPPRSYPALRAAERSGALSDAIHLRRLTADAADLWIRR